MIPRVSQLIHETAKNVCQRNDVILEEFNTVKDHAHLLISYPPKVSLSTFVGSLKANTSRAVREQGWGGSNSSFVGTTFLVSELFRVFGGKGSPRAGKEVC